MRGCGVGGVGFGWAGGQVFSPPSDNAELTVLLPEQMEDGGDKGPRPASTADWRLMAPGWQGLCPDWLTGAPGWVLRRRGQMVRIEREKETEGISGVPSSACGGAD